MLYAEHLYKLLCLEQCLVHSRCWVIVEWRNVLILWGFEGGKRYVEKRIVICFWKSWMYPLGRLYNWIDVIQLCNGKKFLSWWQTSGFCCSLILLILRVVLGKKQSNVITPGKLNCVEKKKLNCVRDNGLFGGLNLERSLYWT